MFLVKQWLQASIGNYFFTWINASNVIVLCEVIDMVAKWDHVVYGYIITLTFSPSHNLYHKVLTSQPTTPNLSIYKLSTYNPWPIDLQLTTFDNSSSYD